MTNYANVKTQAKADALPAVPSVIGATSLPNAEQQAEWLKQQGWRKVTIVDAPAIGNRVTADKVVDLGDGVTCRIQIVSQINIADEQAAREAEAAKAQEDYKKARVAELCESVRLAVNLHNLRLDKPITEEDVLLEAQKLVGL